MTDSTIYECRVYDKDMKLKHIHSKEFCRERYWDHEEVKMTKAVKKYIDGAMPERKIKCDYCKKEVIVKTSYAKYCKDSSCRTERNKKKRREKYLKEIQCAKKS